MKNSEKDKILRDRNDKSKAFQENWDEQLERDQVVMPIDDLPIDEIKYENEEERQPEETKDNSTSDPFPQKNQS